MFYAVNEKKILYYNIFIYTEKNQILFFFYYIPTIKVLKCVKVSLLHNLI